MRVSPWNYSPSVGAGIAFASIYGILTIGHIYQYIHYQRHLYCIPIIIGALWEAAGYAVRVYANQNLNSIAVYATQSILIVLAPAFIAAFNYALLGRLILSSPLGDSKVLRLPPRLITRIFITCDVISFFIQATGGGLLSAAASDPSKANLGSHIITMGLVLQVVTFGFFTAASVRFVMKLGKQRAGTSGMDWEERRRRVLMWCLWGSCFCIVLRSVYRIIEFSQGYGGYLVSHEIYLYIFEAAPMVPPILLFNLWHPARVDKTVSTNVEMGTQ